MGKETPGIALTGKLVNACGRERLPSDNLAAAASFVSEVRHAPHPVGPLRALLHILRHRLELVQPHPIGLGGGQAHCAPKRVDLDPRPEVHEGRAHASSVVPLVGEPLRLLLLLQLVQSLQEDGAEQAGHLVHLGLIGLQNFSEPERGRGSRFTCFYATLSHGVWTVQSNHCNQ